MLSEPDLQSQLLLYSPSFNWTRSPRQVKTKRVSHRFDLKSLPPISPLTNMQTRSTTSHVSKKMSIDQLLLTSTQTLQEAENYNIQEDYKKEEFHLENQVVFLRKQYDLTKQEIKKDLHILYKSSNELQHLKFMANQVNFSQSNIHLETQLLQEKVDQIKRDQEELNHLRSVYKHMHDRLKKSKVYYENYYKLLNQYSLHQELILFSETQKHRKQKEEKEKAKKNFKNHQKKLIMIKNKKLTTISNLQINLQDREFNKETRNIRTQLQAEKVRKALTDDKVSEEAQLRRQMLVNQFYFI